MDSHPYGRTRLRCLRHTAETACAKLAGARAVRPARAIALLQPETVSASRARTRRIARATALLNSGGRVHRPRLTSCTMRIRQPGEAERSASLLKSDSANALKPK